MKGIKVFLMINFFCFAVMCNMASANDAMDAKEFVERASADSVAAIETAKLALKRSTDSEVQEFAEKLIADHREMNE